MRKSTKSVLQTSMFLSAFSHRGSLRAQGIGKGGMRACVPILPKRAFFSSFTSPSNAILCQAFGQCRGGKKVVEQQKRQPHMLPCPQPLKVKRSVYIPLLHLRAQKSGKETTMYYDMLINHGNSPYILCSQKGAGK